MVSYEEHHHLQNARRRRLHGLCLSYGELPRKKTRQLGRPDPFATYLLNQWDTNIAATKPESPNPYIFPISSHISKDSLLLTITLKFRYKPLLLTNRLQNN